MVLRGRNASGHSAGQKSGGAVCAMHMSAHRWPRPRVPDSLPPSLCSSQESESGKAGRLPNSVPGVLCSLAQLHSGHWVGPMESMGAIGAVCDLDLALKCVCMGPVGVRDLFGMEDPEQSSWAPEGCKSPSSSYEVSSLCGALDIRDQVLGPLEVGPGGQVVQALPPTKFHSCQQALDLIGQSLLWAVSIATS